VVVVVRTFATIMEDLGPCHFFPTVSDPRRAERLACRPGIQLAMEWGEETETQR
jgi:hypothetical protein